jgi:hypothetical protein
MGQALQAAIAEVEAMGEAGVLERIEQDDGAVKPAPSPSKRRARKKAAATVTVPDSEAAPETEAPHD